MDAENSKARWIGWGRVGPWSLAVVVLAAIVFGPYGLALYAAGFLKSMLLAFLSFGLSLFIWPALFCMACVQCVRSLRARRGSKVCFWSSMALGIVLAFVLMQTGKTPIPANFGPGLIRRLELRTDIDAVQTWIESVDPNECLGDPHGGRGHYLGREKQPKVLKHQNGMVHLELDVRGYPRVRLGWDESKAGRWGLVIGRKDMKTPPSDPNMYGEQRRELRPGVYFWHVEG